MYIKQSTFEYANKPNQHLPRILAGARGKYSIPEYMFSKENKKVKDSKGKLEIFAEYYWELYFSSDPAEADIDIFLYKVKILKLADNHRQTLESPISIQEIGGDIVKLKLGKSPGLDGLPAEF